MFANACEAGKKESHSPRLLGSHETMESSYSKGSANLHTGCTPVFGNGNGRLLTLKIGYGRVEET